MDKVLDEKIIKGLNRRPINNLKRLITQRFKDRQYSQRITVFGSLRNVLIKTNLPLLTDQDTNKILRTLNNADRLPIAI